MKHRLTGAILLLYPRRVRERHGQEIVTLIDDLTVHDERSAARLLIRLAMDGLVQRMASTATAWTVAAILAATTLGPLAVSDLATAKALHAAPRTEHPTAPARHTHRPGTAEPDHTALSVRRPRRWLGDTRLFSP